MEEKDKQSTEQITEDFQASIDQINEIISTLERKMQELLNQIQKI
jgi:hypothetical protein